MAKRRSYDGLQQIDDRVLLIPQKILYKPWRVSNPRRFTGCMGD
jgi:hypothetical protein